MTFQNVPYQKNQVLTIETGHKVTLDNLIGDGYTAFVFTAWLKNLDGSDENVIVKIAKPNEDAERLVSDEYEKMRKLYSSIRINNLPVTPRVYGYGKIDGSSFIVMEFIKAEPLMELKNNKPLSEIIGLRAGLELFDFLEQLHKNEKLAYPDMKEENFFWKPDDQAINMRVIDLGGLELCSELTDDPRYERDVYRAAQYFFKLMAGYSLKTSWNYELEENPVKPINSLNDLSTGTRNLLLYLLVRDEKFRIKDAHEIVIQIKTLLKFWNDSSDNLIKVATTNIETANSKQQDDLETKATFVNRASNAMDVYLRRFPERKADAEGVCKQASDLDKAMSILTRALSNINTKHFTEARILLSKGEETSTTPEVFRRLNYLVDDLEKAPEDEFSPLFDIYQLLMSSMADYPESVRKVCTDQKDRYPNTHCFSSIIEDLDYLENIEKADQYETRQAYEESIAALKNARANLDKLPGKAKIVRDNQETIDSRILRLEKKIESSKQSDLTRENPERILNEALEKGDLKKVVSERIYLSRYNEYSDQTDARIAAAIKSLLDNKKVDEANRLAQVVECLPEHSQELLKQSKLAQLCAACEKALLHSSGFVVFSNLEKLSNISDPLAEVFSREYLTSAVKNDLLGENEEILQKFLDLANRVKAVDLNDTIQQKINLASGSKSLSINSKLEEIEVELYLGNPWQLQFEKNQQLFQTKSGSELTALIDDSATRLSVLEEKFSQIGNIGNSDGNLSARIARIREEFQRQKDELSSFIDIKDKIGVEFERSKKDFVADWEKFYSENKSAFTFNDPLLDSTSANKLLNLTRQYYKKALLISMKSRDSSIFQKVGSQIFHAMDCLRVIPVDMAGVPLSNETTLESPELFANIAEKYKCGDITGALETLESISPLVQLTPEMVQKRDKLIRAYAYETQIRNKIQKKDYVSYDSDLIQLIQKNSMIRLPVEVIKKYRIKEYLDELKRVYTGELKRFDFSLRSLGNDTDERLMISFKQCVEKLVNIESALSAISENKDSGI